MQHVIRHWQGSLTEADSTAAMQMDAEFDKASNAGTRSQTRDLSDTGQLHSDILRFHAQSALQ